ncbi:Shugoshin 1 [Mucuna pruriens]|uniref:Shugoshin 1 n=1 Tax=Mucuna pruriens TaxID=157652 RepID=A0A371IB59_MUCPR|nr:Shugoshin 1 [Mucuna pruriens]
MEGVGAIFLNSDSEAVGGPKAKRVKAVKGDSVSVEMGASQNKILTDITNLHQQPKQHISVDQLLKEKEILVKHVANRDAIIESCKAELQKCQSNFQKLRKQNGELALTNSQMLAQLNSSRQKVSLEMKTVGACDTYCFQFFYDGLSDIEFVVIQLRELQLELGSKNGVLQALKLELTLKERAVRLKHETDAKEVGAHQSKQSDQSMQEDKRGNAKRKKVSKCNRSFSHAASAPAVIKQVKSTEKVDNQRYSLRRQSTGLKAEKPEPTKDLLEVDEVKDDVSHLQENLANENEPTSLGSNVHDEAREATESSGPTNTEQVLAKKNIQKRHSMRRQTNRFRPENPEPTEDFFEIDDAKFNVSQLSDNMLEKNCPTTSTVTSGQENNGCTFEPQETRRSSIGRPLRRTVEKVVSYKEAPLNVKMRRDKSGNLVSGPPCIIEN